MTKPTFPDRIRLSLQKADQSFVKQSSAHDSSEPPVYVLSSGGQPARPTGRVLVRFADPAALARHREDIEAAGYVIEEVLSYAPQAAWVRAASGNPAEALAAISALERMSEIEEVEPQMLRARTLKPDQSRS
jgi:hypothetical protein